MELNNFYSKNWEKLSWDEKVRISAELHIKFTPYWKDISKIEEITDIKNYEDMLKKIPLTDDSIFPREGNFDRIPPEEFKPDINGDLKWFYSFSSGSTGPRKCLLWNDISNEIIIKNYVDHFKREGVPENKGWIIPGPGKNPNGELSLFQEHLGEVARRMKCIPYFVEVDTTGIKPLLMSGDKEDIWGYFKPVFDQINNILHDDSKNVSIITVVPMMLPFLESTGIIENQKLETILFGGMSLDKKDVDFVRTRRPDITLTGWFGHFETGGIPVRIDGEGNRDYSSNPLVKIRVVDNRGEEVKVGEEGFIEITRTGSDIFYRHIESDLATRIEEGFRNPYRKLGPPK